MAKPRLIILIRHAQSEGNKNRAIHQTVPDHRVKLTPEGAQQAADAGRRLRQLLRPDDTLHIFTSPYRRTRETTAGILETLTSDDPEPSPYRRADIKVYEEPRLREQDFGNFQPCSAEMERMWQERADYGHFFYRIPNGESAADAYDRISGFNESLWRQFGDDDFASVCVLVTHGLMSRVFLMKWYHFTVEYFEDLRNVNHCEFLIMRHQDNGKYLLENKLRTWSELRRERAAACAPTRDDQQQQQQQQQQQRSTPPRLDGPRHWGGCPNGCNHSTHYKRHLDLDQLRQRDSEPPLLSYTTATANTTITHPPTTTTNPTPSDMTLALRRLRLQPRNPPPAVAVPARAEDALSSPDGTPSFITAEDRLRSRKSPPHVHVGRDFGGSYSGHASPRAGSDTDACDSDDADASPPCRFANRLGDDDVDVEHASDLDLERAEREDRSIAGSVY